MNSPRLVLLVVALSLVVSAGTTGLASTFWRPVPKPLPAADSPRVALDDLRSEVRALRARVDELSRPSAALERTRSDIDEEAIAAAVRAWFAQNAAAESAGPAADSADGETAEGLRAALEAEDLSDEERGAIWVRAKKAGLLDELVGLYAARVAADPGDADAHSDLGAAYLQSIEHLDSQAEQGVYAMEADASFDAALELDPEHWEARFLKALSLSMWPAMAGKRPESIRNFETLLEQQERSAKEPHFVSTYLFLGNMYADSGDFDRARAIWVRGAQQFPDSADLRKQLRGN